MASSTKRVTKKDLLEWLKKFEDKDFVGVFVAVQENKDAPCHEVLMLFQPTEKLL